MLEYRKCMKCKKSVEAWTLEEVWDSEEQTHLELCWDCLKNRKELLYKKYKKAFGYIDTIIFNYMRGGKNLERFKRISMDYNDLKQEVYLEMFPVIEKYDKDYIDSEKVHLAPHIKKLIFFKISKILRDNRNKIFIPIDTDLQEDVDKVSETLKTDPAYAENMPLVHPDLIPDTNYREHLTEDEISTIIRSCDLPEIDCRVLELRIIDNMILNEIRDELGLESRQAVHDKLKRGIAKLSSKYKTISQLFER